MAKRKEGKARPYAAQLRLDEAHTAQLKALQAYAKSHNELSYGSVNARIFDSCIELMYAYLANPEHVLTTYSDLAKFAGNVQRTWLAYLVARNVIPEDVAKAVFDRYLSPDSDPLVGQDWQNFFNASGGNQIAELGIPFMAPEIHRRNAIRQAINTQAIPPAAQVNDEIKACYDEVDLDSK